MKEQADLTPIVDAYNEYKSAKQASADSEEMLEMESDEEMRELAKEELLRFKKMRVEELEHELKILLLPKILMMIRTLWWKSVQVEVEMNPHCCCGSISYVRTLCGEQTLEDRVDFF